MDGWNFYRLVLNIDCLLNIHVPIPVSLSPLHIPCSHRLFSVAGVSVTTSTIVKFLKDLLCQWVFVYGTIIGRNVVVMYWAGASLHLCIPPRIVFSWVHEPFDPTTTHTQTHTHTHTQTHTHPLHVLPGCWHGYQAIYIYVKHACTKIESSTDTFAPSSLLLNKEYTYSVDLYIPRIPCQSECTPNS